MDRELGVEHMAGNEALYKRQIIRFIEENRDFLEEFDALLQHGDHETAHRLVHSLKSMAAMVGAERLAAAAAIVEAGVDDNGTTFDKNEKLALEMELHATLEELQRNDE